MRVFVVLAAMLQVALGGALVSMPYPNPAGVTYVGYSGHHAPLSYSAGAQLVQGPAPLQYSAPFQYQHAGAIPARIEAHHVGYASAQVPAVAAVPFVKHIPTVSQVPVTRYEAHPALIEKQVDVLKPAVSTRKFEVRRPAIQKQFYDIEETVRVRPAGSALVELDEPTSKLQRGPTVVQPLSEGSLPIAHHSFVHGSTDGHISFAPSSIPVIAHAPVHINVSPVLSHAPIQGRPAPIFYPSSTPAPSFVPSSTPAPSPVSSTPSSLEEESVVVENADFRSAQFSNSQQFASSQQLAESQQQADSQQLADSQRLADSQQFSNAQQFTNSQQLADSQQFENSQQFANSQQLTSSQRIAGSQQFENFQQSSLAQQIANSQQFSNSQQFENSQQLDLSRQNENSPLYGARLSAIQQQTQIRDAQIRDSQARSSQIDTAQSQFQQAQLRDAIAFRQHQEQQEEQFQNLLQNARSAQENTRIDSKPQVVARSNGAPQETLARFSQESSTVPSIRNSPEESIANQKRLIDLLTARGGVTEVGFGGERSASLVGDAGNIRARVLSATPAPDNAEPTGERVSTRRVVVSRPIETLQEIDVVEPATKYQRVSIQHPTLIKTAHLDHVQVHGSVPVVGKALAPAVAETSVPIFQKTISPAYNYYK